MIHISMYMNDQSLAKATRSVILNYLKVVRCAAVLNTQSNINAMVSVIDESNSDIYIIDFSAKEVGLELCKLIRKKSFVPAIFAVNIDVQMIGKELFFRPSAVLGNVTDVKNFIRILDTLRKDEQLANRYFAFKYDGESMRIPYESIECFESNAKLVTLSMVGKTKKYRFAAKLGDVESKLPDYFLRCHQSYIVNMKQIAKLDTINHSFFLFSKEEILISRRMYTDAVEKYQAFLETPLNEI